ncbi:hypothetical protein SDC9_189289 [bioreactor metagenome]|uniref:Uncharacterized protein n=1 Tax=bioreactor metagenome TaxID=1076179 RepID=A0A645I001_9ZZZZ
MAVDQYLCTHNIHFCALSAGRARVLQHASAHKHNMLGNHPRRAGSGLRFEAVIDQGIVIVCNIIIECAKNRRAVK